MIKGKTYTGFAFELEDDVLDDWELVDALRSVDKGNAEVMPDVFHLLLSERQQEALKANVRGDKKKVSMSKMVTEIADILNSAREGKNS